MSLEDPTPPLIIWQLCDCHDRLPPLSLSLPSPHCFLLRLLLQFNLQISEGNIFSANIQLKGQQTERQKVIE